MTGERKKELIVIVAGAVLLAAAIVVTKLLPGLPVWAKLLIFAVPYLVVGQKIIIEAVHGIFGGEFLDENFLMAAASIGAMCVGEHLEAVLVMLLYRIGELLQSIAVGKSRDAVSALMDICPDSVNLETVDGISMVSPEEVHPGDVFVVRVGERVPLDGVVLDGSSSLNTSALTGESVPREVVPGDSIASGCINLSGVLRVRSECEYEDSTVARMLELIEGASANKSKSEKFITKFARWYTPVVVGLAVLLAILPPLLFGGDWRDWIYRALNFLVISCPCALVISVPLTFFGGIGAASRNGILVKGSNCFETLAKCGTAVFDKTGTLTLGRFRIASLVPAEGKHGDELLRLTAAAEQLSTHPIAACIAEAGREKGELPGASSSEEIAGEGVRAVIEGRTVLSGNGRLMKRFDIAYPKTDFAGTVVYTAVDGEFFGWIGIEDELKSEAPQTIAALKNEFGIRTAMLTGDRDEIGRHIAEKLGLDEVHTELLPENKVELMERLIERSEGSTAYVGDGINDAPVIARADVGFAMGGLGSDAAIEAADVVLMDDNISKLPLSVRIAKRTVKIAWQNIIFALAVKFAVLILGAFGYAQMYMAIIADVGVCLIAVLNAMRAMKIK